MTGTTINNIRLLGSLELPHPGYLDLDVRRIEQILSLVTDLQKLDDRDLRSSSPRILVSAYANFGLAKDLSKRINFHSAFQSFKTKEDQAWKASTCLPEKNSCLVPPSGSLDSAIAHHLHQPSFTTKSLGSTDIADKSNGCIAMVMGTAFQEGETLLFDHLHRRSRESDCIEQYPQTVLDTHEEFTHQIMASSAAKVEIVYGRSVQKRILQTMKTSMLPLWGRFKGIFLVLLHECNFCGKTSCSVRSFYLLHIPSVCFMNE
jgi:hypothetical protein